MDNIIYLRDMLTRLHEADAKLRVFGSTHHHYQLGPTLSERKLDEFETTNEIRLPDDYRQFLLKIGNGGAGPYYGLEPLSTFGRDLSRPFPFKAATDSLTDEELQCLTDHDEYPGVLEFCHQGCGIYSYLVVSGPTYGTLWDGREDFYPTGLSFGIWYQQWLERALVALKNEKLVSLLRVGMNRSEVQDVVGGIWHERQAFGRPIRYFEATDIPCQLELDERDVVVKINPWPHI